MALQNNLIIVVTGHYMGGFNILRKLAEERKKVGNQSSIFLREKLNPPTGG